MAKATLINIKTGKEVKVDNPEEYLKKYKGVFKLKPATQVSKAVTAKEAQLDAKNIEVKSEEVLSYDGLTVTEANVEQFAKDNDVDISKAKTAKEKIAIVAKFIGKKKK